MSPFSPALTLMFVTGLASLHVAAVCSQPPGTVSDSEKPLPGTMLLKVRVFDSVASASSSSWKVVGLKPPPAVKLKSCGSSGVASLTTVIEPRFRLVKVHVTISAVATLMFVTGLPSLHVALERSQPAGHGLGQRVAAADRHGREGQGVRERRIGVVVQREARGAQASARREGEVLRIVRLRVRDNDDLPALAVGERAGDVLARAQVDVRDGAAVAAGGAGLVPARRHGLRQREARAGGDVGERVGVGQRRVRVVVEREARRRQASARGEAEVLRIVGSRVLDDRDRTTLQMREGAGHDLGGQRR